jgi:hypothetical protein
LGSVASIALGPNREIHALSSRTGAVHVFDEAGRILRVCEPDPKDFSEKVSFLTHLTVAPTGDVYVERATMSLTSAGEYVHFDHKGKRVGIDDFSLGDVTSTVYFQPTSGRRWVVGYQTIVLTDGAGKALRTIDRSADGRWFGTILRSAQSPDGSLAFLAPRRGRWSRWTRGGEVSDSKQLHVLDRDGGLVKTVSLPENMISYVGFAFDGTRAAFLVATGERSFDLVVVTVADGSGIAFPLGSSSDGFQAAHLPPGLDEVWISSGDSVLRRFAIGK